MSRVEAPLGPSVKQRIQDREVISYPYQEQKDLLGPKKYKAVLVLGEGPVNEVKLRNVLTPDEAREWDVYMGQNPQGDDEVQLTGYEAKYSVLQPAFHVIDVSPSLKGKGVQSGRDRNPFAQAFADIEGAETDPQEKELQKIKKIQEWQEASPMVKRRWGRANALAGGMLLYLGKTDKLILSGGKTGGEKEPGKVNKPSEAEMLRDVIVRRYGRLMFYRDNPQEELQAEFEAAYPDALLSEEFQATNPQNRLQQEYEQSLRERDAFVPSVPGETYFAYYPLDSFESFAAAKERDFKRKKYHAFEKPQYDQYIYKTFYEPETAKVVLEQEAGNTIGNIVYSANKEPQLFEPGSELALVTSGHHLQRGKDLIARLTGKEDVDVLSAQAILEAEGEIRGFHDRVQAMQMFQLGPDYDPSSPADKRDRRNKLGQENIDLRTKVKGEEKWSSHLVDPDRLLYWIGYVGELTNPSRVQSIISYLEADDYRRSKAEEVFRRAGISFAEYHSIAALATTDPDRFTQLQSQLATLTAQDIRKESF